MSKTARFSQTGLTTASRGAKRQKGSSFELEGHHIRQLFLATTVLSWVGIAFTFRLF